MGEGRRVGKKKGGCARNCAGIGVDTLVQSTPKRDGVLLVD